LRRLEVGRIRRFVAKWLGRRITSRWLRARRFRPGPGGKGIGDESAALVALV
jgi:hypothetical protein